MEIKIDQKPINQIKTDVCVVPVKSSTDPLISQLDKAFAGALGKAIASEGFEGKAGDALRVHTNGAVKMVVLVGANLKDTAAVRAYVAKAVMANAKYESLAIFVPKANETTLRAASSGALAGSYKYTTYLTGDRIPKKRVKFISIVSDIKWSAKLLNSFEHGVTLGETLNFVRDLVNAPPNDMTPTALANAAKQECTKAKVDCKIWDKKGIEKIGMNLFLAVNRGSAEEPRLVHMTYKPKTKAKKKIVFVGKGLTYDSGGLCIKPPTSMSGMKNDMAGAAVTIGIVLAAAKLKLPVEVHGIIGCTENMTGSAAFRPDDIFKTLDGKTVEIINTDAEGRLVLADVLTYASQVKPDVMIDHATLTGACLVALGPYTAGFYSIDASSGKAYLNAAKEEGESMWQMPLLDELKPQLKSDIADLKNLGDRMGGSITAALFLREFIGDTKAWMHLDIAGPAFNDRPFGISPAGASGFGLFSAVKFLEQLK